MTEPNQTVAASEIDISDTEYVTPAQAAAIRAMYAEEQLTDARLAEIELHRRLNETVAKEPEE